MQAQTYNAQQAEAEVEALASYLPPLYVAGLYWVARLAQARGNARQGVVIDTLAVNWLLCEVATLVISPQRVVPAFMTIDLASALYLSFNVRGRVAGMVEVFYLAMIVWNAAFFFARSFEPMTHWWGLSALSWAQLAAATGGIVHHDLAKAVGRLAVRLGVQRYLAFGKKKADE